MSDKRRITHADALALAEEVLAIYDGTCERIEIAGSIRRKKPTIGDIEICLIPKFEEREAGLFGDTEKINLQMERTKQLIEAEVLSVRLNKNGDKCPCGPGAQYLWYKEFPLDIFGVIAPSQWGVIFAIRTGPEAFNRAKLVLTRMNGGILQTGQNIRDGQLWDLGRALVTPEESDLFEQIGHPFIPAEKRAAFAEAR